MIIKNKGGYMKQRNPKYVEIRHREQKDNCKGCKTSGFRKKLRDAVSRSYNSLRSLWKRRKQDKNS